MRTPCMDDLKRRLEAHPAFHGGQPDEAYWLDMMEFVLASFPEGLAAPAAILARVALGHPEKWPLYALAASQDPLAWKIMETLACLVPRDLRAPNAVYTWALDVAGGKRQKPKDRPDKRKNGHRDSTIAVTVNGIRDLGRLPYASDERRSACRAVAERLGMSYTTVRSIWRRTKPLLERARGLDVIPPPRRQSRSAAVPSANR